MVNVAIGAILIVVLFILLAVFMWTVTFGWTEPQDYWHHNRDHKSPTKEK